MMRLMLITICSLACYWAWDYASPAKRKERAQKRREAGERTMRRILGR
jgi:cbb3-type cytochrome oxidase subunit 3